MAATPGPAWFDPVREILDASHLWQPDQLATRVDAALSRLGVRATIFLVDQEQQTLRAVPVDGRQTAAALPVDGSVAGRAFTSVRSIRGGPGQPRRTRGRTRTIITTLCTLTRWRSGS